MSQDLKVQIWNFCVSILRYVFVTLFNIWKICEIIKLQTLQTVRRLYNILYVTFHFKFSSYIVLQTDFYFSVRHKYTG
jgi:hypothetical protein